MSGLIETDRKIKEFVKEKKRNSWVLAVLSIIVLANLCIFGYVVHQQGEVLDRRAERISVLESNLDNQRSQFLNCINAEPNTSGCTYPISPDSSDIPGPKGEKGMTGPQGPPGKDGKDGEDGAPGIQGVAGKNGENGKAGDTGTTGPQGPPGQTGNTGASGADGEDAPRITSIVCDGSSGIFTLSDGSVFHVPSMCQTSVVPVEPEIPVP